jgi:hypothetical protein
LADPSRFGAIVVVTVLSCVVLGAVWGFVIYVMPQTDSLPQRSAQSLPTPSSPPPPLPALSRDIPTTPDHSDPPVQVKEVPAAEAAPLERPASEGVRLPFGMDVKCAMEMDSLCPEDEVNRGVCLQRKAAQLSIPCRPILRERLVRMKENMQQMRVACETDRRQYCRGEALSGGAIVQCLEAHAQEVSDQCFQFLPKRGRLLN